MKKVVIAFLVALLPIASTFAGENPKLFKEIQRKITLDLSQLNLEKTKEHYVIVQFKIVNGNIDIINVNGTEEELTELTLCELEEMCINSKTNPDTIYRYKFSFEKEG